MVHESTDRFLIVNADDFGLTQGINRGIFQAHERGIVTSASLMVRGEAAEEAGQYARRHPALSVGLHIDLAEWEFVDGAWRARYEVVPADDAAAVAGEIERQLKRFEVLVGRPPTHLDSHQHVHRDAPVREIVLAQGERLDIPVRHMHPAITYCGAYYGQMGDGSPIPDSLSLGHLEEILRELPPGITELLCHPGLDGDVDSVYREERAREVETLCDPRLPRVLEQMGIVLLSFSGITSHG
jgi:predicted glycoside hydrolase/deacetylase ChbG (UPF0249 family)